MDFFESFIAVFHFFLSMALKVAFAILKSFLDNIADLDTALSIFFLKISGFFSGYMKTSSLVSWMTVISSCIFSVVTFIFFIVGFFWGYIYFFLAIVVFVSWSTIGFGNGKMLSAAKDFDGKMIKNPKKITLNLTRFFII